MYSLLVLAVVTPKCVMHTILEEPEEPERTDRLSVSPHTRNGT